MAVNPHETGWRSPFDENEGDLPVERTLDALVRTRNGEELTTVEHELASLALIHRPDLVQSAGIELEAPDAA